MHIDFPLTRRELSRAGRRNRTYMLRLVGAGFLLLGTAYVTVVAQRSALLPYSFSPFDWLGPTLGRFASMWQYAVALLLSGILTAGSIAGEKEEGTLRFLALANYGGRIFFAKFVVAFLEIELLLLGTLPILAFAAFFGGISPGGAGLQLLLLSLACAAVCAIGLLSSTVARSARDASTIAFLILLGWLGGTAIIDAIAGYLKFGVRCCLLSVAYQVEGLTFSLPYHWPAILIPGLLALGAAALSVALLPRQAYERVRVPRPRLRVDRAAKWWRLRTRAAPLVELPYMLSFPSGWTSHWVVRGLTGLAILSVALITMKPLLKPMLGESTLQDCAVAVLLGWAVLSFALHEVVMGLATMSRNGGLEDLSMAPTTDTALALALVRAFLRRARLALPALAVSNWGLFGLFLLGVAWRTPRWLLMPWPSYRAAFAAVPIMLLCAVGQVLCGIIVVLLAHRARIPVRHRTQWAIAGLLVLHVTAFLTAVGLVGQPLRNHLLAGEAHHGDVMVASAAGAALFFIVLCYGAVGYAGFRAFSRDIRLHVGEAL